MKKILITVTIVVNSYTDIKQHPSSRCHNETDHNGQSVFSNMQCPSIIDQGPRGEKVESTLFIGWLSSQPSLPCIVKTFLQGQT